MVQTGSTEVRDGLCGCQGWGVPTLGGAKPLLPQKASHSLHLGLDFSTQTSTKVPAQQDYQYRKKSMGKERMQLQRARWDLPGCLGAIPSCCPWKPLQLRLQLQHRSHLWREESVRPSVRPTDSRGGLTPTTPHHPRSARRRCHPGRAWPWGVCCRPGGLGVAPGGGAGPGGQGGDGPAGWGCARGACPACGPAGDAPWAAASVCRWRAHARASSGTAGAW